MKILRHRAQAGGGGGGGVIVHSSPSLPPLQDRETGIS